VKDQRLKSAHASRCSGTKFDMIHERWRSQDFKLGDFSGHKITKYRELAQLHVNRALM